MIDRRGRDLNRAQQAWLQRAIHFQLENLPKSSPGTGEAAQRIVEHLIVRLVRCIKEDIGTVSGSDKLRASGYVKERGARSMDLPWRFTNNPAMAVGVTLGSWNQLITTSAAPSANCCVTLSSFMALTPNPS